MLPRPPMRSRKCPKRGEKPGKLPGFRWTTGPFSEEKEKRNSLKMRGRHGNVYENKGQAFHGGWRSGNVVENKGSYALKAGMLLKTSMLAVSCELLSLRSPRLARDAPPDSFRASAGFQRTLDLQVGAAPPDVAAASEAAKQFCGDRFRKP
jgi:hypothetical protein